MKPHTLTITYNTQVKKVIGADGRLRVLSFNAQSPVFKPTFETVEGRDGEVEMGGGFEGRMLRAEIKYNAKDILDFYALRDEVFRLLHTREQFEIVSSRQSHKRWRVRVSNAYFIEPQGGGRFGSFIIEFKSEKHYALGDLVTYDFKTNYFTVPNDGDIEIDPRSMFLTITYKGASKSLEISQGGLGGYQSSTFRYNGETKSHESLVLDRVRPLVQSKSVIKDTNRGFIVLSPGNNTFRIGGFIGDFSVSISFRPCYL
ncbi:phage tail family protein [Bacillus paranthracis]|uniref:phage tail domain-containing protein n=1 Tax=Bacillus paranthracis TaxID=2026186 RepID=UPI00148F3F12|nr:phage tail domain-containing protein [Bacillus paranthracis]NOP79592.1 phage tail family protein [Bacillus paranthracis]